MNRSPMSNLAARALTLAPLAALSLSGCITPIPSVTDLTERNAQDARALSSLQDESLDSFREFIHDVQENETQLVEQTREQLEQFSGRTLLPALEAKRQGVLNRYDAAIWNLLSEEYPGELQMTLLNPLQNALDLEENKVEELRREHDEYPEDRRLARDYQEARKVLDNEQRALRDAEAGLRERATERVAEERTKLVTFVDEACAPMREELKALDGISTAAASGDDVTIEYSQELKKLDEYALATKEMFEVHFRSLETVDDYMSGDRVSFLFRDGTVEELPVPTIETIGLPSLGLAELDAVLTKQEARIQDFAGALDQEVDSRVSDVRSDLNRDLRNTLQQMLEDSKLDLEKR
ncbi:MAG: hypothetical protein AAF368_04935 [Planctomycetota bacterium]